jgi:hypothetical protein
MMTFTRCTTGFGFWSSSYSMMNDLSCQVGQPLSPLCDSWKIKITMCTAHHRSAHFHETGNTCSIKVYHWARVEMTSHHDSDTHLQDERETSRVDCHEHDVVHDHGHTGKAAQDFHAPNT